MAVQAWMPGRRDCEALLVCWAFGWIVCVRPSWDWQLVNRFYSGSSTAFSFCKEVEFLIWILLNGSVGCCKLLSCPLGQLKVDSRTVKDASFEGVSD